MKIHSMSVEDPFHQHINTVPEKEIIESKKLNSAHEIVCNLPRRLCSSSEDRTIRSPW